LFISSDYNLINSVRCLPAGRQGTRQQYSDCMFCDAANYGHPSVCQNFLSWLVSWFIKTLHPASKKIIHKNPLKSEALAEKKLVRWVCFGLGLGAY